MNTITQVYKNLLQYKLDLKYFNDKQNPKNEKDVEINKTDIVQFYIFDEELKGKFVTTYKKNLNKMNLDHLIQSCKQNMKEMMNMNKQKVIQKCVNFLKQI